MKKALSFVRSLEFAFLICICAMIGQGFHSYYCFYNTSHIKSDLGRIPESLIFVFVWECFTLFFLMRGRTGLAKFFSFCLFIMNCYYYITAGPFTTDTAMGLFLSIIIPVSIYFVAEEVKKEYDKDEINTGDQDFVDKIVKLVEIRLSKKKSIKINNL